MGTLATPNIMLKDTTLTTEDPLFTLYTLLVTDLVLHSSLQSIELWSGIHSTSFTWTNLEIGLFDDITRLLHSRYPNIKRVALLKTRTEDNRYYDIDTWEKVRLECTFEV